MGLQIKNLHAQDFRIIEMTPDFLFFVVMSEDLSSTTCFLSKQQKAIILMAFCRDRSPLFHRFSERICGSWPLESQPPRY